MICAYSIKNKVIHAVYMIIYDFRATAHPQLSSLKFSRNRPSPTSFKFKSNRPWAVARKISVVSEWNLERGIGEIPL